MIYACYCSKDKNIKTQYEKVKEFVQQNRLTVSKWIEIDSPLESKQLQLLISSMDKGDTLLIADMSVLGMDMLSKMDFINQIIKKQCDVRIVEDNARLGVDVLSDMISHIDSLEKQFEEVSTHQEKH